MSEHKKSILDFKEMKKRGEKITVVTAYDYSSGMLVEKAGIDTILVGDSLGMTMLGYDSTVPVTMEDMIYHTKAVARGAKHTHLIVDLPFMSYEISIPEAIKNGGRLMKEAGADSVKLEGGGNRVKIAEAMVDAGIPVMGHLGLTPQTAAQLGGFKVQGKTDEAAEKILSDALALEEAGVFAIVLECVPAELGEKVTQALNIPTIGIGAGKACDGQVLVYHDLLGLYPKFTPKFVKRYAHLSDEIISALTDYRHEVKEREFPSKEYSF